MNMRFFSSHTLANTSNPQSSNQRTYMPLMIRPPLPPPILPHQSVEQSPTTYQNEPAKKVLWGEPTWYFLHVLSVKIKESEFPIIRQELLNMIYGICINLPCPDCSNHAKTYLDGINFNSIQTKEDLKRMLHIFHNEVNKRKGYPYFPYEELDKKYEKAITVNIIHHFIVHFEDRRRSKKLLAGDLHRVELCKRIKTWLNENKWSVVG